MTLTYSLNELDTVAKQIIKHAQSKILLFNAEMGMGKTTLIKAIVKALGSDDEVSSPTFSLVNEYRTKTETIFHFDLYRINDEDELYNFGIEEYINSKNWIIAEWPNLLKPLLQDKYITISITSLDNGKRCLVLSLDH